MKATESYAIADRLLHAGQAAAAAPYYAAACEGMPEGWKPRVERAEQLEEAFWDKDDFVGYVAHAKPKKKVVWTVPSYSRACYHVAFAAVERNDLATADEWIERGLALEPDHPLLLCEKALVLGTKKRHEDALHHFQLAAKSHPWHASWVARALRGEGFELIELRRLDEAETAFKKSLELEPGSHVARSELEVIRDLRAGARGTTSGLTRGGGEEEAQRN